MGFAIFQQHGNHLLEVLAKLVESGPLRVCARPAGDVAYEKSGSLISLDDCGKALHVSNDTV